MKRLPLRFIATLLLSTLMVASYGATITVPGTSNPWLAGMPIGSVGGCGVDSAPDQSPVLFAEFALTPGQSLLITASGSVGNGVGGTFDGPDGSALPFQSGTLLCGAENGIADLFAPKNSLLGVFLGDSQPNLSPAPGSLSESLDSALVTPDLRQVFFIGDGLTTSGTQQQFVVPVGATRLFLGTMDSYEWNNNTGQFTVEVVPEPGTVSLLGIGVVITFAFTRIQRRRNNH